MSLRYKYDTFNARYLSLEEVANTFIPNKTYQELHSNSHTLLMGPRGCGKTTLLKMLTPKAIYHYNNRESTETKIHLPYIGIYIPSDKQWEKQLEIFQNRFEEESTFSIIIAKEIVNTNILLSLLNTLIDITQQFQWENQLQLEAEFCSSIVDSLKINKPIAPTFYSIVKSLKTRIVNINVLINKIDAGVISIKEITYPEYFFSNFLDLASICCSEFERIYKDVFDTGGFSRRWAFCFDELEIAPEWLQKDLITNHLRSREQKFLFKLTTTPLIDTKYWLQQNNLNSGPSQTEDYQVIRNWVFNRESNEYWKQFSEALFISLIKREFGMDVQPELILGKSHENADQVLMYDAFDKLIKVEPKRYSKGSIEWHIFKLLAEDDRSFYEYLSKKEILPFDPYAVNQEQKDAVFRKVKPIVYLRYYFKKGTKSRTRNIVSLYSGVPLIYEISDGNPRTLLNIFDSFKSRFKKTNEKIKSISISDQARTIKNVSDLKLENIKNHPEANIQYERGIRLNLGNVLSEIGNYFFAALVVEAFTADPVGTFIIDKNVDDRVVSLLKFGLNIGAIQYINPKQDISDEDVYNKIYRLSYSLFPCFNLPIREYGTIQLSRAFPKYAKDKRKARSNDSNQSELFS